MTREEAKEILIRHNEWRRGGEGEMESPKLIGEAIDIAIEALGSPSETDYTEQMRQLNEEWKENMRIQRTMLIDKVWKWFEDILPDTILDVPKCKEMFYADMKKED